MNQAVNAQRVMADRRNADVAAEPQQVITESFVDMHNITPNMIAFASG